MPHVLREKRMLTWVPLDTPRQEVLVRKSSRPPTRSLGMLTSMVFDLQNTGTAGTGGAVRAGKEGWEKGEETTRRNSFSLLHCELFRGQIMLIKYCIISQMKKYCSEVSI